MKRFLAVALSLLMVFAVVGYTRTTKADADVKVGVVLVGDENEGYTYAHILGVQKAIAALGLTDANVVWKYNVP